MKVCRGQAIVRNFLVRCSFVANQSDDYAGRVVGAEFFDEGILERVS